MQIFKFILFFTVLCQSVFAQSIKPLKKLPDTGQNTSYTNTFGEDNDYTINPPSFKVNGDGTTTDLVTGLQWQQTDGGEMTVENAKIYCDSLTLGGFTDWRLPSTLEAYSMLNHQSNPAFNASVFTKTGAAYWWTNDFQVNDKSKVWVTNSGGGIGNHLKSETISAGGTKKFHVRAVRYTEAPTILTQRFTLLPDNTVKDNGTDLTWYAVPTKDSLTWEDALQYSENLNVGNRSDWRLPNIKELQSLADVSLFTPCISKQVFPTITVNKFWSSTSLSNQTTKAWYLDTQYGITTYDTKTNHHPVLCVSGGGNSTATQELTTCRTEVFPNPFSSFLQVTSDCDAQHLKLYSPLGKLMYEGKEINHQDFSGLPKGMYILIFEGGDVRKVIKL